MSVDSRRVETVFSIVQNLALNGEQVHVGEIADALRAANLPIPVWQLRADCTQLAEQGRLFLHHETGAWIPAPEHRTEGAV
jgi:hypothetical protein